MPLSVPASTLRLLFLQHPKPHVARQRARASARRRGAVCGSTRERTPPPPTPESSARLLQLSRTLTRFCPCGCGAKTPLPHTRTVSTTGRAVLLAASEEHPSTPSTKEKQQAETTDTDNTEQPEEVQKALKLLKWYKRSISPLLPPSCRFVPTCSEYSMAALQRYGLARGCLLTAWRLLRCNPFCRQDWYDPPQRVGQNWYYDAATGAERIDEQTTRVALATILAAASVTALASSYYHSTL